MEYKIDAKNKYLGRLASDIATILQGKKKVSYNPKEEGWDSVVVSNIKDLKVSGKKMTQKIYERHTGYMGHLKTLTYAQVIAKKPGEALRRAVKGMLPKNFLQDRRLRKLIIKD